MKKQDNVKLGVLSRIDEKILDKATDTRFRLLMKKRRNGRAPLFYGLGAVAACLAIIFCAVFLIPLFTKQIPIYTGMTVSNTAPTAQSAAAIPAVAEGEVTLLSLPDDNPFAMSYSLKTDNPIASENGIRNEPADSELTEEILNTLTVTGTEKERYYARPNGNIFITVHIDNPDQFEIQSFTLNGKKYSSYMFEEGSDMENLILKLNVGDVEGMVEYTIDAIKYIDGTEIKDVRLDGERTVKVGVYTEKQPTAEIANETVGISSLALDVTVGDEMNLIGQSEGVVAVILCDWDESKQFLGKPQDYKLLSVGQTEKVTFENLSPDHDYVYYVIAYYDALDGKEMYPYVLYRNTVKTEKAVWIENPVAGYDRIDFSFVWSEVSATRELTSLELRDSLDNVLSHLTPDTAYVDGLLSGYIYRLVAKYQYSGQEQTVVFDFLTTAKAKPLCTLSVVDVTQTTLAFNVTETTDPDNVGEISKIELLHATEAPRTVDVNAREFVNLLSGNTYTLRIAYTFDLNDGEGVQTKILTKEIRTEGKAEPTYAIVDTATTQTGVSFGITENDTDNISTVTKVELLHRTETTRIIAPDARSFDGLLSGNEYTLKITYIYDLNDGNGVQEKTVEKVITTQAKTAPTYAIVNTATTQTGVSFGITENDTDNIGFVTKIELLHATEATRSISPDVRSFDGLLSGNRYTLKITYTYDLNDGTGVQEKTVEKVIRTQAKTAPKYSIDNLTASQTKIDFDVTENDTDNVGAVTKVELLHETEATRSISPDARSFDGLLSGNEYTVRITYTYNLNDGTGVQEKTVEKVITTQAKTAPKYSVDNLTASQTKIDFDVTETDADNIGTVTKIELLHATEETRVTPDMSTFSFDGLSSANAYTIRITYTYDLNDGTGLQTRTVTADFATLARTITVTDLEITGKTTLAEGEGTSLKITLNNPDNVPVTNLVINGANVTPIKAEYYGPNVYIVQSLTLPAGQILQLRIEQIDYAVSIHSLSQSSDFQDDEEIAWIGSISLKDASAVGGKKYYNPNETVTVIYYFEGLEHYTVFSIDSRPATKIDASTYSVSYGTRTGTGGNFTFYQCSIAYGISNEFQMQTSVSIDNMTVTEAYSVWWFGPDTLEISTPEQLQNMNTSGGYYRLVNDIDLSGIDWVPYAFDGILHGSGYEIKNLTLTEKHAYQSSLSSPSGDNPVVSMFKLTSDLESPALIDVKLTGVTVNITVKGGENPIYVLLLVQNEMGYRPSYNCAVEGSITYVDYANHGANIWCMGYESGFVDCSFAGIISYIGGGELTYHLCGDYHAYCENGVHTDNIPCSSAANTTVYINGVKQ